MVNFAIILLKYWLEAGADEPARRLADRIDDGRKTRLNIISHLLTSVKYDDVPRKKVELPKRQKGGNYREPNYRYKFVPETH